jgi:hypothetical protein
MYGNVHVRKVHGAILIFAFTIQDFFDKFNFGGFLYASKENLYIVFLAVFP